MFIQPQPFCARVSNRHVDLPYTEDQNGIHAILEPLEDWETGCLFLYTRDACFSLIIKFPLNILTFLRPESLKKSFSRRVYCIKFEKFIHIIPRLEYKNSSEYHISSFAMIYYVRHLYTSFSMFFVVIYFFSRIVGTIKHRRRFTEEKFESTSYSCRQKFIRILICDVYNLKAELREKFDAIIYNLAPVYYNYSISLLNATFNTTSWYKIWRLRFLRDSSGEFLKTTIFVCSLSRQAPI